MSQLAERIRERLEATGKTARGASLEAGLGPDAIRIILDGRSVSPRMATIAALAPVLECDVAYLMGDEEPLLRNLRNRMASAGLNPFSLAAKAGLDRDYVRSIFRGRARIPGASGLTALANALDTSVEELLGHQVSVGATDPTQATGGECSSPSRPTGPAEGANPHERLKAARERAGYATAAEAARRFGWPEPGYRHHENGTAGFAASAAEYAKAFGVSPGWLLFGEGPNQSDIGTPITREPAKSGLSAQNTGKSGISIADGRVTLNLTATVSVGTAAKILALIEEDRG